MDNMPRQDGHDGMLLGVLGRDFMDKMEDILVVENEGRRREGSSRQIEWL